MEVQRWNIRVVVLEPGCIVTPIWKQYEPSTGAWTPTVRDATAPYTELQLRFDRYFVSRASSSRNTIIHPGLPSFLGTLCLPGFRVSMIVQNHDETVRG